MNTKEIFSVLGRFIEIDGNRRFMPDSPAHYHIQVKKVPLDKQIWAIFNQKLPSRSEQQLSYHFVLAGYLSDHTGYTKEEIHDAVMKLKFGTKKIKLDGKEVEVRKSISNRAKFPKDKMSELIEYDLELCNNLEIRVPTASELGYILG